MGISFELIGFGYRTRGCLARRFRRSTDRLQRCERFLSRRKLSPACPRLSAYFTGSGRVELSWFGQSSDYMSKYLVPPRDIWILKMDRGCSTLRLGLIHFLSVFQEMAE